MAKKLVGALVLVAGGFVGGVVACGVPAADAQTSFQRRATPVVTVVRVAEDGSGVLPEGTFNSVLGDLSGRGFCLYGELCND